MKSREIIVGLVFLAAVGVALYFAIELGGTGQIKMPWEAKDKRYRAVFPQVGGLSESAPVWVSGVPKGQVRKLYVDPRNGQVEVTFTLDESIRLHEGATAEIISSSAFGGKTVVVGIGDPRKPDFDSGTAIQGTLLEDVFTSASRSISKIDEGIDIAVDTLKEVNAIVKDVRTGKGPVGTVLYDEKVADDIRDTTHNIRTMSEDGKSITSDIRDITNKVNTGDGTLSMILNDADTAQRVKRTIQNVEDTSDHAVGISRAGERIANNLAEGKGLFGALLVDDEVAENGKGIIRKTNSAMDDVGRASKDIADIVGKANRGEGTLGKIINDPTLYNDLLNGINTLRAGFEDIREQAPITTFATLLFQVFQ
ncbi:MAG: MCE family protein [Planctomycetes bacterium]|jgi:phospholipid/cholesterol/gamma-HCH transport system substrate-binding protein|nr:MCE family protein [Planctomycetota bacterium]